MKHTYILPLAAPAADLETVGGKGMSLAKMLSASLPVPDGFHITTAAYRAFVAANDLQAAITTALGSIDPARPESFKNAADQISQRFDEADIPAELADEIQAAYLALKPEHTAAFASVAVRSSATAEDLPDASFAGQQETFLNVSSPQAVLAATKQCWASLWTGRAISYRTQQGIGQQGIALAVVVQEMVFADAAGILFTANPINGQRQEIVINAAWGLGEAVVGGRVTPDTTIVDKATYQVLQHETADKLVMTVRTPHGTQEQPVPAKRRRAPVLSAKQATALAKLAVQIEDFYGMPMDIEWTLQGDDFAVVQARPITALAEPTPPVPTEWKLPKGAYAAMRNNIVELMIDPLTPLFKTLGLRALNASMTRTMNGFLGDIGLLPDDPIITVNEYAYYNGSVRFGPMLKVILDTRGIIKRMFTGAVERWTETGRPQYVALVQEWEHKPWQTMPTTGLLAAVNLLAEAAIDAYMALVSGVIPASWMSEAWFTWRYKFLKRKTDPDAFTYLMGFNSLPIQAEKALYDLAEQVSRQVDLKDYIIATENAALIAQTYHDTAPASVTAAAWQAWAAGLHTYLKTYGHMIYNLDFGNPVPADDPAPVIETIKMYLNGQGSNPHTRQQAAEQRRVQAVEAIRTRLSGRKLQAFDKNLARAQKFAPLREDGLADVGLSYPLLRKMLRVVGERLVKAGIITETDQIFWLTLDEVEQAAVQIDQGKTTEPLAELVPQRKATWQAACKAAPPIALPQMKVFGLDLMELKSGGLKKRKDGSLKGVAASPGTITAPACVLHGPEDFAKMNTGDVLVAPITTPAWTPLFARAAAVVTDIGGPLSHGSIVAREYGIPAVLGTGSATSKILSGQTITVDGDKGIIYLENGA